MKKSILILMIVLIFMMCFCLNVRAETLPTTKWNLYFENIEITEGSVTAIKPPKIKGSSNSEIDFDVNLKIPGEFYEFTVDVANAGTMDAMVSEISDSQLNDNQKKYLAYEVTYLNGNKVQKNDLLKAGTTVKLKIRIEFKKDIDAEDLPKEDATISLVLNTCYVQADNNANEPETGDNEDPNNNGNNENGNNSQSGNGNESGNGSENDNSKNSDESKGNGQNSANNGNGNEQNTNGNKSGYLINNVKTGDAILKYVVIFVLATIAILFTIYKSKKGEKTEDSDR